MMDYRPSSIHSNRQLTIFNQESAIYKCRSYNLNVQLSDDDSDLRWRKRNEYYVVSVWVSALDVSWNVFEARSGIGITEKTGYIIYLPIGFPCVHKEGHSYKRDPVLCIYFFLFLNFFLIFFFYFLYIFTLIFYSPVDPPAATSSRSYSG